MAEIGCAAIAINLEVGIKTSANVIGNAIKFESAVTSLETRISSMATNIDHINAYNQKLRRPTEETEMFSKHVEKGQKLLGKCKKIKWWNCCFLRPYYAQKISQLNSRFLQTDFQVQKTRDKKEVLLEVKEINEKMGSAVRILNRICNQDESVMAETLKEEGVKLQLPGEKVEGFMASATSGSEEITSATEICHHREIRALLDGNSSMLE